MSADQQLKPLVFLDGLRAVSYWSRFGFHACRGHISWEEEEAGAGEGEEDWRFELCDVRWPWAAFAADFK